MPSQSFIPGPELQRQYRRIAYPLAWVVTLVLGGLIAYLTFPGLL